MNTFLDLKHKLKKLDSFYDPVCQNPRCKEHGKTYKCGEVYLMLCYKCKEVLIKAGWSVGEEFREEDILKEIEATENEALTRLHDLKEGLQEEYNELF